MKHFVLLTLMAIMMLSSTLSADIHETVLLPVVLSPSREVPIVTDRAGSGNAAILIVVWRDDDGTATKAAVDFNVVNYYFGQAESLLAMHIHKGPEGVSGPIVIRSGFEFGGTPVDVPMKGKGTLLFHRIVEDPAELAVVEDVINDPKEFYLNIHSASNPPGLLRGQLSRPLGPDKLNKLLDLASHTAAALGILTRQDLADLEELRSKE